MAVSARFAEYVLEQLGGMPALRSNRMFNGVGIYSREVFFALLHEDTLYFKTGDSNIAEYRERGMAKFMPFPDRPSTTLGYHQVPADVLEDPEMLVEWARKAVSVALAKAKPNPPKRAAPPKKKKAAKRAASKVAKKVAKKVAVTRAGKPAPRPRSR